MTCGIHRKDMAVAPWGRYIKNNEGKYEDFIQCKPCKEKEVEDKIKSFQESGTDTEYTDDIICPHCGQKHEQDGEREAFYYDGEHDFTCGYCNEDFTVSTSVSYTYSTYKLESDRAKYI